MLRSNRTNEEWIRLEAEEMDLRLSNARPFGRPGYEIHRRGCMVLGRLCL